MSKCVNCKKDISRFVEFGGAISISCEGDFVCSDGCKNDYDNKKSALYNMSDKEFENYITN